MFDEMKMKAGIVFNCKTGKMAGFVSKDDMSYSLTSITKEIISNLKAYNKKKSKITNYFKGSLQLPTKTFSKEENEKSKNDLDADDVCEKNHIASKVNLF